MTDNCVPRTRACVMRAALAVMMFILLLPLAVAQPGTATAKKKNPNKTPASAGQRVVKDPVTGELRAPTAEEAKQLEPARTAKPRAKAKPKVIRSEAAATTGAVGMPLDESYDTYTVATRSSDGKVKVECVDGAKQAAKRVQQPASKEADNEK